MTSPGIDPRFVARFVGTLTSGFRWKTEDNVDPFRFPGMTGPPRIGLRTSLRALQSILRMSQTAASSADALADPESKRLLLDLCAFRVFGGRHYRLRRNDPFFWQCVHSVEKDLVVERGVSRVGNFELDLYRIEGTTGPIELEAHATNVLNTFLVEEYRLEQNGIVVEAGRGDIVIDGGGCWGDTALYFADRIGTGKVFVFEFEERNLEVLRRNLARNPRLADRIEIIERALWSTTGETLKFADGGPGTRVGEAGAATGEVESLSIDEWASAAKVPRVDFIKMDIEGAEVPALEGARRTIRACSPKLAISTYHSIAELLSIPRFLQELGDYDVHLAHATIHAEETIAFGAPARLNPARGKTS